MNMFLNGAFASNGFRAKVMATALCLLHVLSGAIQASERSEDPLKVFLNADLTHTHAVGKSIKMGLQAGIAVGTARYDAPDLLVVVRDHRNNMRRTERMIDEAINDPATLAVVGGMHSPHYFKFGHRFNENNLVLMLPWSAGGRLTRMAEGQDNHIFRVSLDDRKAAPFLAEQVVASGCQRIATFSMENGWGRGNIEALSRALADVDGIEIVHKSFMRRDAGERTVEAEVAASKTARPDCVVMVMGDRGSAFVVNALANWDGSPPVFSHWGILGGNFMFTARPEAVETVDVAVLSTCLLTMTDTHQDRIAEALNAAAQLHPGITELADIPLPMAFAHAYDLGLILSAAAAEARSMPEWSTDRLSRSAALRLTLEDLRTPVDGVLKTYNAPFGTTDQAHQDGHEALGREDLCLSQKSRSGRLALLVRKTDP